MAEQQQTRTGSVLGQWGAVHGAVAFLLGYALTCAPAVVVLLGAGYRLAATVSGPQTTPDEATVAGYTPGHTPRTPLVDRSIRRKTQYLTKVRY